MPRKHYSHKRTKRAISIRKAIANRSLLSDHVGHTENENAPTSEDVFERLLQEGPINSNSNTTSQRSDEEDDVPHIDLGPSDDEEWLPDLLVEPSDGSEECNITGRRIVDMNYMLKQLKTLSTHNKRCTMGEYKFNREIVSGLYSKFIYYCDNCETEAVVTSEPEGSKEELNDAVVWGALSIGTGHQQIQELFGIMDVPVMGPKKFKCHEKKIGKVWEETLLKKMKENAAEERKIAIEKNNFLNGVPYITVIGDGGWAKRSYGHGMNSSSGVGVIIGAETKKLLFIGVRNKFCYVCTKHKNNGTEPPTHDCFLNYHGSSTGMESDIIVDGFKRSEEDYGLVYKFYIGDGDSSVYAHIQERCSYGRYVKKIECANHVTRALNDQLHRTGGNTSFPLESRKLLLSAAEGDSIPRLERIIKGIRTAIKDSGTTKSSEDVANLRSTIKNCIDHVFGNHARCTGSFCTRKGEVSVLHQLDEQFLTELRKLVGRVEAKAESLVFNQTTNRAEHYMSLVSKFTGGKRINLSSRGSYRLRCLGAGLSHTSGPSWHLSPLRKLNQKSPGRVTKSCLMLRERRRNKRRLTYETKGAPKKKLRRGGNYDSEYGPLAVEPDVEEDVLEERKKDILAKLAQDDITETKRGTLGQHSNVLWQEKRMNRLTASKFGVVAKRLPQTSCHNLVKDILYPRDIKTQAILFGRVNEDVAIQRYEEMTGNVVTKCGLFIDEHYPYLGASPDGLVGQNGLVEVKCLASVTEKTLNEAIANRKKHDFCLEISDTNIHLKKAHSYHYQIQGQLHIAKKEWCDFIVYTMSAPIHIERINRDDDFWEKKIHPKVTQFYLECVLPEIADSRIVRGLKTRDPLYIQEAKKRRKNKKEIGI